MIYHPETLERMQVFPITQIKLVIFLHPSVRKWKLRKKTISLNNSCTQNKIKTSSVKRKIEHTEKKEGEEVVHWVPLPAKEDKASGCGSNEILGFLLKKRKNRSCSLLFFSWPVRVLVYMRWKNSGEMSWKNYWFITKLRFLFWGNTITV